MVVSLRRLLTVAGRPWFWLPLLAVSLALALRLIWALTRMEPVAVRLSHDLSALSGTADAGRKLQLQLVAEGFEQPTDIQFVPGHPHLAVVLQKKGRASAWQLAVPRPGDTLFEVPVQDDSEMGLLGLAFHPQYLSNGLLYLNYIPKHGERRTRVAEWRGTAGGLPRGAQETRVLLEVSQPYGNHDGGQIAFGPDGQLYIALGDGGSRADPHGNGQNTRSRLGKILRIDPSPDGKQPYTVPADNPFVGNNKFLPEIWAYGLRNPWRFSFSDRGDLLAADVGQDQFEEVDQIRAGDNLGWNVREAGHCFKPPQGCGSSGFVEPIFEYGRALGNSITGGFVYRGTLLPKLRGKYIFGDFGSGRLWALPLPAERGGAYAVAERLGQWDMQFSTFGQSPDGELYVTDFYRGKIYQLRPL